MIVDQPVSDEAPGKFGEFTGNFLPDSAHRNTVNALAAREQVDYLVRRRALINADAVAHQGDLS